MRAAATDGAIAGSSKVGSIDSPCTKSTANQAGSRSSTATTVGTGTSVEARARMILACLSMSWRPIERCPRGTALTTSSRPVPTGRR